MHLCQLYQLYTLAFRPFFIRYLMPVLVQDILVERSTSERSANYEEIAEKKLISATKAVFPVAFFIWNFSDTRWDFYR